jgi:tetratricopeptide (TPR) repeat protein
LAIKIDPEHAPAYVGRALAEGGKSYYDEAIADFDKAIEIDSKNAGYCNRYLLTAGPRCVGSASRDLLAYTYRGVAYLYKCDKAKKSNYETAIASFDKAIEIDPKNALAYYEKGIANGMKGEHDKAIVSFDKAIEIDPKNALAYYEKGIANGMKGEHDKAITDFDTAIEIDPKNALAYAGRGTSYFYKSYSLKAIFEKYGNYLKAIGDFNQAIMIDPGYGAYYNRGAAFEKLGRKNDAISDYWDALWRSYSDTNGQWDTDAQAALRRLGVDPLRSDPNRRTMGEALGMGKLGGMPPTDSRDGNEVAATHDPDSHAVCATPQGYQGYKQLSQANIMHDGLGEITSSYRGRHQFFNDDIVGSLFSDYYGVVVWPFFQSGLHVGANTAVGYYETNKYIRTCFILIYFLMFFSTYELGKQIFHEVIQKRLVGFLRGFGEHVFYELVGFLRGFGEHVFYEMFQKQLAGLLKGAITRHGLTESLNGARLLPGAALRKITATYELAKHISYEMLRKNLERLIGLRR